MKLLISDRGEMEERVAFAGKIPTRNACLSYKNGRLCSHDMQSSLLPTFFYKHNIRTSDAVLQQRRSSGDPGPPRPPPGAQAEADGKRRPVLRVRRMHYSIAPAPGIGASTRAAISTSTPAAPSRWIPSPNR
jgi:hypothetical protein